jgi:hypothetical protein
MADTETGFLGRWARRKTEVLQGKPVADSPVLEVPASVAVTAAQPPITPLTLPKSMPAAAGKPAANQAPELPALSLDDVKLLTKDSDFAPYMARTVDAGVRNAAMKKLFADPHFNIMDGLDIYIDDYSLADPIPESMLRQMVSSKFLNLFDDENDVDANHAITNSPNADLAAPAEPPMNAPGENTALGKTHKTQALSPTPEAP